MKIMLTGVTGLIGKSLAIHLLKQKYRVSALARDPSQVNFLPSQRIFRWNSGESIPPAALEGANAVVHLAGESVVGAKWSADQKQRILQSRVESTKNIIASISALKKAERPRVLICASAIGIYGERGNEELTENSAVGSGFLAEVCESWEEAAREVEKLNVRLVLIRTGIVLAKNGGALSKMPPVILGRAQRWTSWIHLEDEIRFIEYAIQNEHVRGAYNLVAPNPITNEEFCQKLAKTKGFPLVVHAPAFFIQVVMGKMSEVLLASQRVLPKRILESDFQFKFPNLQSALSDLFANQNYIDQFFESVQYLAKPLEEVFSFFSLAENLEILTPPWLEFKIESKSTPDIRNQTKINYRLKIHGVSMRWQSCIDAWDPGVKFVDYQVKGPYAKWLHEHLFFTVDTGTLMIDRVVYRVPASIFGKAILGPRIKQDIQKIFDYRKKVMIERFGS